MEIGILTAFLGGLISFLSPCVLPLAPPYLAFLGGTTLDQISGEDGREIDPAIARRVFISACFFVAGLATVFVALGMTASLVGQLLLQWKTELAVVSGLVIFALGLHFFGLRRAMYVGLAAALTIGALHALDPLPVSHVLWIGWVIGGVVLVALAMQTLGHHWGADHIPLLHREARFDGPANAGSFGTSYVIGLAFAFGWTPCIGPILAAILTLAAQQQTLGAGTALLAVYALGLGVPFLLAALFVGPFLRWAKGFRRHLATIERAMGFLLVVVGLMILTGEFERLAYWLLETFPILATIG